MGVTCACKMVIVICQVCACWYFVSRTCRNIISIYLACTSTEVYHAIFNTIGFYLEGVIS